LVVGKNTLHRAVSLRQRGFLVLFRYQSDIGLVVSILRHICVATVFVNMIMFSHKDEILIKNLHLSKGHNGLDS